MASGYEKPITIEQAIKQIVARQYLLPAIQRNFTWSTEQICVLFDSIMRNYPINSLMLWQVNSTAVSEGFRFYAFLERYVQRFAENNPNFDTKGHGEFYAVIDGQQRLTSLYIGLKGTFAYKVHRAWWPKAYDPKVLPPRKLYLNLAEPLVPETNDNLMLHDFQFLTADGRAKKPSDAANAWFEVGRILEFPTVETDDEIVDHVLAYLDGIGHAGNTHARRTLHRLYHAVRRDLAIHLNVETSQEIDHVLDIFVRTNQGGTPLSKSDLLMSITAANWEQARERVDELVNQIRTDIGFSIDRNFVMKAAVMLTDADVRFQVKNFDATNVAKIKDAWDDIREAVAAAFHLVSSFGLNDASLRAKNAVIPIAYYLFHKGRDVSAGQRGLFTSINKPISNQADRKALRQWLLMSLLRGVFGRSGDQLLTSLRHIIRANIADPAGFPLQQILDSYRGTTRDLTFDGEFIERLLKTQKNDPACYSILALLQPALDINQVLHVDHLHPAVAFSEGRLNSLEYLSNGAFRAFYEDRENWNGLANLHLLSESENTSKQATPLKDWVEARKGETLVDPLIPPGTDLAFAAFPTFVQSRSEHLRALLESLVGRPASRTVSSADEDDEI